MVCGEEIPERRLRALPFATRCKDCEEALGVAEERVGDLMVTPHVERQLWLLLKFLMS